MYHFLDNQIYIYTCNFYECWGSLHLDDSHVTLFRTHQLKDKTSDKNLVKNKVNQLK